MSLRRRSNSRAINIPYQATERVVGNDDQRPILWN